MPVLQVLALLVSLPIAVVGITLFVRAIRQILATLRIGQPTHRTDNIPARSLTLTRETLLHTRMLQWSWVGAGHWFVMTGFGLLFFTLVTAFGQLFSPSFHIPLLGHFFLFEWATELFTWVMLAAIIAFICYRATRPTERVRGPRGRFFGSTMWQGYFVELVILGVGLCIVLLRGLEYALATYEDPGYASAFHFPLTFWLGEAFSVLSETSLANLIWVVATIKIVISFAWMITISLQPTMGVAWHRFLAFFNIFLKRDAGGRSALGGLVPMTSGGKPVDFEDLEEMDEDTKLGVGAVEDFSWKGILDFSTCTECGRCQSQCPAWNTEKPLSPKMLILGLRDHAYAKAPYLQAESEEARAALPAEALAAAERPLVGATEGEWAWNPTGGAVIDDDVLWSCTSCGACVQQCPVDIEHVDHIVDMRRYQVLVESNFPSELNGLFKGLENKGNPWNMSPKARLDWAKDLPFEVKVVGEDVETLDEVEWLFWVGCAGAYEDRAKKTTRAVAELLDMAGVDFAVLGNGETCTGDPARRAGNEFVFQGLAAQNAQTLQETKAKKVVSTCAHCFNTLKNEYAAFGVELEVVHHTQLLNRLVREKKLTPVATNGGPQRSVTYHDPCYIGRHNGVYSPPRELLEVIPDAQLTEMPRNSERSFCCGAGGARMWMEENIGERINLNRTQEAIDTGAEQIAVGCPFCRVMLSDGLTMKQSQGEAREEVEVLDVAQMLLASVKGESPAPRAKSGVASGTAASGATTTVDESVKAEPSAGDATQTADTVTDTEDVGPLAKASGGSSLFDTEPEEEPESTPSAETEAGPAARPEARAASGGGGSLFDLGDDEDEQESPAAEDQEPATEKPALGGGSMFDLGGDDEDEAPAASEPTSEAEPAPAASATESTPGTEIPDGGSLFDLAEPEEQTTSTPAPAPVASEDTADVVSTDATDEAEPDPELEPAATTGRTAITPGTEIPDGGSLFDLAEPEDQTTEAPAPAPVASEDTADAVSTGATDEADTDADETDPEPGAEPQTEPTATTRRTSITPGTEIPDGGSLFDLAEPEERTPEAPAPTPAPAAGEPAADDTGDKDEPEPAPEPKAEAEAAPEQASGLGGKYPPGRSMFDLPAATAAAAPAAASPAETQAEAPTTEAAQDADPTSEPEPAAAEDPGPVASLKDIKAGFANGEEVSTGSTEVDSSTGEDASDGGGPRPPESGEAHRPRTDADITESSSLFDL